MAANTGQLLMEHAFGIWTLKVKANGGSVAVEKSVGSDWVTADTFATDGAYRLDLGNSPTRFTPAGGAVFEVVK